MPSPNLVVEARERLYDADDALERAIDYLNTQLRHTPDAGLHTVRDGLVSLRSNIMHSYYGIFDYLNQHHPRHAV